MEAKLICSECNKEFIKFPLDDINANWDKLVEAQGKIKRKAKLHADHCPGLIICTEDIKQPPSASAWSFFGPPTKAVPLEVVAEDANSITYAFKHEHIDEIRMYLGLPLL